MQVILDQSEPVRPWWVSFWFAVVAIIAVVGGMAYAMFLFAQAVAGEVA